MPTVKPLFSIFWLGRASKYRWPQLSTYCGDWQYLSVCLYEVTLIVPRKTWKEQGSLLLGDKHLWVCFCFSRSQVNLQIPAVGCLKVSLVQAGLVGVLRKGSTLGGELGIVTCHPFCIRSAVGFLLLVSAHQDRVRHP